MRLRGWVPMTVVPAGALLLTGAFLLPACGRDSERSERRTTTTTTTTLPATTPTTVAPQTAVSVPPLPPPPPTTGPPPPVTVPRRTPRTTTSTTAPTTTPRTTTPRTTTPRTTTEPTVTAAPGSTTSRPGPTSTTKPKPVTRKTVVYSPPGGPKLRGDLVVPKPHTDTLIVLVHGGDGSTGTRKQMRGWADFYAEHGYPSFAIDYLLSKATVPPPVYPKPETDVKAAVQYLREHAGGLGVDPDRIIVQGFDAGAALGAQAEVTSDDAFFGGPGHYPGVSDKPAAFIGFYGPYGGGQRNPTRYYGGPPGSSDPTVQQRYAKADSIAHAADAAGPALLVQGDAGSPELVASATMFRDALQGAGKDVTLTLVTGAGASFDQEKSGELTPAGKQTAQQVVDWLAARFPAS